MENNNDNSMMRQERRLRLVGITYNQIESGVYALILEEEEGNVRLPIVIGYAEAQAIECKLQNVRTPRPLTHDLMHGLLKAFGATLRKIVIYRLPSGVFAANLHVVGKDGNEIIIDSRSSDAVALALRADAPIYTTAKVLEESGFAPDADERGLRTGRPASRLSRPNLSSVDVLFPDEGEETRNLTDEQLRRLIDRCVENEDYEKANDLKQVLLKRGNEK